MKDVLSHTYQTGFNWGNSINEYNYQKKNLEWGFNPNATFITAKKIKNNEVIYNPILQVYRDKRYENELRIKEKNDLIDTIVRNQDNELKIEQTYNVINLRDRLKGFENDPLYPIPKEKLNRRKNLSMNKTNYNILSNIPFSEHYFDKPENRPKGDNSAPIKKRRNYTTTSNLRDYDIISTRYKKFHDEKTAIDKEINKVQTAQIFFKNNNYNPIKGKFFDENKEKAYQEKLKDTIKNWGLDYKKKLPSCAKGQSELYNLVSMKVVNPEELKMQDIREKNKKQRYELKYKLENFYHDKSEKDLEKKNDILDNKYSYKRYKVEDERQYNIIDLGHRPYKEHSNIVKKDNMSEWEKLVKNAGDNNTFIDNKIYRDPYDYTENNIHYDKFMSKRKSDLNTLPLIGKDPIFESHYDEHRVSKIKESPRKTSVKDKLIHFDKIKFFKGNKNVNFDHSATDIKVIREFKGEGEKNREKNTLSKIHLNNIEKTPS